MNIRDHWDGTIEVNGADINTVDMDSLTGAVSIHLMPKGFVPKSYEISKDAPQENVDSSTYKVKVRAWMTKRGFEFMTKWNNDIPMPLRVMVGIKNKETEKMINMTLHGDILEEVTQTCMCCGKPITNAVSKYFGMGPVCGNHNYVNPFNSTEELKAAVQNYRAKLQNITWTGWIPKSAIEEIEKWD